MYSKSPCRIVSGPSPIYPLEVMQILADWRLGCLAATAWWRQCTTYAIAACHPWQAFMYLKSSILHRFNRHTSSFLPSHPKSQTEGLPGVYSTIWYLCYKANKLKRRKDRRRGAGPVYIG